ncbi:MAG: hypothetical protein RBU30_15095 [Polyangia bacterium]|jgi:hypothetical protein|nr:hypothetical protein [Polyangia bacterium]
MVERPGSYRLPLVGTLLLAVGLELALHRALLQFLKPEILEPESELFRLFNGGVGPLVFYFTSFLALVACAWILILVVQREGVFSLPWRVVLGLFSCVFLPVCAVGAFVSHAGLQPLSPSLRELHPYLNLFFAPMLAGLVAGLLARPGRALGKAGVILLVAPLLGFAYFSYRTASSLGQTPGGVSLFEQLRSVAVIPQGLRTFFLHSGPLVFLGFMPLVTDDLDFRAPPGGARATSRPSDLLRSYYQATLALGPLAVALGAVLVLGAGIKLGFAPLRTVVDSAFTVDLPTPSAAALLLMGSLFLYLWTLFALAWRSGPNRTTALGLGCVGIAGLRLSEPLHSLQLPEPLYYLLVIIGLIALCVGIAGAWDRSRATLLGERSPVLADERWIAFLQGLASLVSGSTGAGSSGAGSSGAGSSGAGSSGAGSSGAGSSGAGSSGAGSVRRRLVDEAVEISGFEVSYEGIQLSLSATRRGGRVESLSVCLGEALGQAPDWSARPRSRWFWQGDNATELPVVRDRSGLSARLLGEGPGASLPKLHGGTLEVWQSVGLLYGFRVLTGDDLHALLPVSALVDPSAPIPRAEALASLFGLLRELALRAGVTTRSVEATSAAPDPAASSLVEPLGSEDPLSD